MRIMMGDLRRLIIEVLGRRPAYWVLADGHMFQCSDHHEDAYNIYKNFYGEEPSLGGYDDLLQAGAYQIRVFTKNYISVITGMKLTSDALFRLRSALEMIISSVSDVSINTVIVIQDFRSGNMTWVRYGDILAVRTTRDLDKMNDPSLKDVVSASL